MSQYFGNLYLTGLDHKIKEQCKCKYYFRYCDDLVILHKNKKFLHSIRKMIEKHLTKLKLKLKENWQVFPIDIRGLDFLGYRFFHNYILLRNSIKKRFIKKIRKINKGWENLPHTEIINSIMSYYGWFKYANCKNLQNKYFDQEICWIIKYTCDKANI